MENRAHLQPDPRPRAPLRQYRLGAASNFVVVYMSEADNVYARPSYFTVPPNRTFSTKKAPMTR